MVFTHPPPRLRKFLRAFGLLSFCTSAYWFSSWSKNFSTVSQTATVQIILMAKPTVRCPAAFKQKSRDLLMTAVAVGPLAYDKRYRKGQVGDIVDRFAGSFRKSCGSADIVFLSPGNASADVYEILQRLKANWVLLPEEASIFDGQRLPPGNVVRHSWFTYFFTKVAPGQYDRVLIVDANDVYFQSDPFAAVGEPSPELLLTQEPIQAKHLGFFRQNSLRSGYSLEEIEQCNELLICGGLFFGKPEIMKEFFSRLLKEAMLHVQTRYDQHYIYHLRRKHILDDLSIVYKSDQSLIWHLSQKKDKFFEINEEGLITDGKGGPVVPILHHIKLNKGKNLFFYLQRFQPPIFPPDRMIAGRHQFSKEGRFKL